MRKKSKPLILATHPLFPEILRHELADQFKVQVVKNRQELFRKLPQAEGLITLLSDRVESSLLDAAPRLRAIANYAVGTNNIDLRACAERGVRVVNTPGVLTRATAELAITLLLACARRVPEGETLCRRGQFKGWNPQMLLGQKLEGRRALIVGGGRIGKETARLMKGLGLLVQILSRKTTEVQIRRSFKQAQVLSLHLPYTPETHHWLSRKRLSYLPPDAIVINTARGAIHDEAALIEVLQKRKIFAAGLDVYEFEPEIPIALRRLKNVVLLPHLGSATLDTRLEMAQLACSGLKKLLLGRSASNEVKFSKI